MLTTARRSQGVFSLDHKRLLVRIARMYYEDQATQNVIASALGLSRPKVQRLLQEALGTGIVQIRVVPPDGTDTDAEREVERRYGLREVIAVEVPPDERPTALMRDLGCAAARYVRSVVRDGMTVGLSWGHTLAATVAAFDAQPLKDMRVVQILGALPERPHGDEATGLARRFALALNAPLHLVPAPGIVASEVVQQALLQDPSVGDALRLGRAADVAIVGIGTLAPQTGTPAHAGLLAPGDRADLLRRGAVGDIALRFFDETGCPVFADLDRRVVGLTLEELRAVDIVAVAGGPGKYRAIRAALRGGFVNVLITDAETARRLAEEARE